MMIRVDVANSLDPAELSFGRGEILEILDRSGKWWGARKADGSKGSECFFFFRSLRLFGLSRVVGSLGR
jgi:SH3 domain